MPKLTQAQILELYRNFRPPAGAHLRFLPPLAANKPIRKYSSMRNNMPAEFPLAGPSVDEWGDCNVIQLHHEQTHAFRVTSAMEGLRSFATSIGMYIVPLPAQNLREVLPWFDRRLGRTDLPYTYIYGGYVPRNYLLTDSPNPPPNSLNVGVNFGADGYSWERMEASCYDHGAETPLYPRDPRQFAQCVVSGLIPIGFDLTKVSTATNRRGVFVAKPIIDQHPDFFSLCANCGAWHANHNCEIRALHGVDECPACNVHRACHGCGQVFAERNMRPLATGHWACVPCADREGPCEVCGQIVLPNVRGELLCRGCRDNKYNPRHVRGLRDSAGLIPLDMFMLESLPFRPARLHSIETELGGVSADVRKVLPEQLYAHGLSNWSSLQPYHPGMHDQICHVENDASVDAELVVGRINPADKDDMTKVLEVYRIVNKFMDDGKAWVDGRCGGHQHVDVSQYSKEDMYAAYRFFCRIEDLLYRLGSAWWPFHRMTCGSGAARPINKGLTADGALGLGHASGIQTSRFRPNSGRDSSSGTCEFRLWNSTANLAALKMQMVLGQSIIAAGQAYTMHEPDAIPTENVEYNGRHVLTDIEKQKCLEQLRFMFEYIPMTENDRQLIRRCAAFAPLGLTEDAIKRETQGLEYCGPTKPIKKPSFAHARAGTAYREQKRSKAQQMDDYEIARALRRNLLQGPGEDNPFAQ